MPDPVGTLFDFYNAQVVNLPASIFYEIYTSRYMCADLPSLKNTDLPTGDIVEGEIRIFETRNCCVFCKSPTPNRPR